MTATGNARIVRPIAIVMRPFVMAILLARAAVCRVPRAPRAFGIPDLRRACFWGLCHAWALVEKPSAPASRTGSVAPSARARSFIVSVDEDACRRDESV